MENNNQSQPDYSKELSKEEIIKRLTDEPIEVLRIRYKAFEAAKRKMIAGLKERAKNDPELAEKLKKIELETLREKLETDPDVKKDFEN